MEEVPFEDTTRGAEEIAPGKPPRRAPLEGGFMAPKPTQDLASTSESSAAVVASEENTAPMLTCECLSIHDARTLSKTDIAGMDLTENDPGPSEAVPSAHDEISRSQLEPANACVPEILDLKHTTASDAVISIDGEKQNQAAPLPESIDESQDESEFYSSSHDDGEDDKDEEKETDVSCGKAGDSLVERAEESHVAEESHQLVTSYESSHQETVTIEEEPHRREGNLS